MDIAAWLRELGLGQYAEAFAENDITGDILGSLDDEDLKTIGVQSLGHRKRLLAAAGVKAAAPVSSTATADGERRPVTVMFADLTGFTQLANEIDAEDLHTLLGQFFQAVDAQVQAQGGTIDKHIGDCTMALFGAPVAHGDDPLRAVRAALGARNAVAQFASQVGRPVGIHIGVAGGEVVASRTGSAIHSSYTVTGNSVHIAARLTDLAGDGEILITDHVYREVAGAVDAESAGARALKGIDLPVEVWRLRALSKSDSAQLRHSFVGRRAELAQFSAALANCRDDGTGSTLLVRGEPGIGKTRLIAEFHRLAEAEGLACHTALVLDFGAETGADPARLLSRCLLGVAADADAATRNEALGRAISDGLIDSDQEAYLGELLDVAQAPHLRAIIDAQASDERVKRRVETLATLAARSGRRRSLLLVVEDIHWADIQTLNALAGLAAATVDAPILLVFTSRREGDPLDAAWRARVGGAAILTVDLARLRDGEARELALTVGGGQDLIERCLKRAEGNPLFLEQLLHNADEGTAVPGSVQSVVLARVDRLDLPERRALQAASVLGQRFDAAAVRFLLDEPKFDFAGLVSRYLIRPEGGDAYLFGHALIREGIYAALLHERARELHKKAAAWFEDRDVALFAEHLGLAADPRAVGAFIAAAEQQRSAYRNDAALSLVRRARPLAKESDDIFVLDATEGEILLDMGRAEQALGPLTEAEDAARKPEDVARALYVRASALRMTDRIDEALLLLVRAEEAAREAGRPDFLARIHHLRGNLFFPQGRVKECLVEQRAALEAAEAVGAPELIAMALGGLADAEYANNLLLRANQHFRECVALARQHGFGRIEVANGSMIAITQTGLGPLSLVLEEADGNIEMARKVGHGRAEIISHHAAVFAATYIGDADTAMRHLAMARELTGRLGARRFDPENDILQAIILLQQRRHGEAAALAETAWSKCDDMAKTYLGGLVLGYLAQTTQDPSRRQWALEEGERLIARNAVGHNLLFFRLAAIEASLDSGFWNEADRHADALEDGFRDEPTPMTNFMIARARLLARQGRGEPITKANVGRLIDQGRDLGYLCAVEALEALPSGDAAT
jgi:class 3 adenylate cyclase/tetratricopeptide (TPR) repeat protein